MPVRGGPLTRAAVAPALLLAVFGGEPARAVKTGGEAAGEPPNAAAVLAEHDGHITLTYSGRVILDATLGGSGTTADRRVLVDTLNGAVTQVVKWAAPGELPIQFSAVVHASDQAFPAEADRRDNALPVVRSSVGLSYSLLNRAVYDRASDWVISIDFPARVSVAPVSTGASARTFRISAAGTEVALRFRPRYYQRHRGLAAYRPWTYRVKEESVAGWSSWFAFFDSVTQRDVQRSADVVADSLAPFGYRYLQIDDGYQRLPVGTPANWLNTNAKFPGGLGEMRRAIAARGLAPGLWTNTTFDQRDWALAHPGYFVRDANGSPAHGNWIGYVMDGSNAMTLDTLVKPVYRALRGMGWQYFKLDALRHLKYEGYNSHSAYFTRTGRSLLGAYRSFVQAVRTEVGMDAYLLACWGIRPELAGLVDGMRVSTDGFGYGGFAQYNSFNNVVWRNDPDNVELAHADATRAASITSLTGSLLMLSDRPEVYSTPRVEIARRVSPVLFALPQQLFDVDASRSSELRRADVEMSGSGPRPLDAEQRLGVPLYLLDINRPFQRWSVLARDASAPAQIPFVQLGLPADREFVLFEFWSKSYAGVHRESFTAGPVDSAFGVQVFCIRAREEHPQLLATNRHVTCGGPDLRTVDWQADTLVGESDVVAGDQYVLYLTEPAGWRYSGAVADGAMVVGSARAGDMRTVTMRSGSGGRVRWRVAFRPIGVERSGRE